jgi:GSCFA family
MVKLNFFGRNDKKGNAAQSPAPVATGVTVLSTDNDACSAQGLDWLLKCIFREDDLLKYAKTEFGSVLLECKSYAEATNLIYGRLREKASAEKPAPAGSLVRRAFEATLLHESDTQRNRNAYTVGSQKNPESGWWPEPSEPRNQRSLFSELPFRRKYKFITRKTAVVSAGSCFASEIAYALQREGLNYVVTEHNSEGRVTTDTQEKAISDSSAAWGDIFNTPSFRQLVEYAFGLRTMPRIVWELGEHFLDPFRDGVKFNSIDEYEANYEQHVAAARAAFEQAEVFIITLGLNEVWYFKMDNSVFSRSPWRIAPSFVEHKTLSVAANVAELQLMLDILRANNPQIKVIVTVSPVPLHATFLHETYHVVEANLHSKSVLRVAAQEFVEKNQDVYYFPSFELATYGVENPWCEDQRHVDPKVVQRIMEMFRQMFVIDAR